MAFEGSIDFAALKENMNKNKGISEDTEKKIFIKYMKEDDDDDMITRWIAGESPKMTDLIESVEEYAEKRHYFDRHPEMKKYLNKDFSIFEILDYIDFMNKCDCFKSNTERYSVFIENEISDIGSPLEFEECLDYVITDILKNQLDLEYPEPEWGIFDVAKKSLYYERHPEMILL